MTNLQTTNQEVLTVKDIKRHALNFEHMYIEGADLNEAKIGLVDYFQEPICLDELNFQPMFIDSLTIAHKRPTAQVDRTAESKNALGECFQESMYKDVQATINSIEVATMVKREHGEVLKDLRRTIAQLAAGKIPMGEYFQESTYLDANNQSRPCFNLTKKGCELYATRMTGTKGTVFAVKYIERFNEMEQALQKPKLPTTYKEALQQLLVQVEENEKLQTENLVLVQQNNELQPKASYYDLVLQNKSLLTVTQISKDYGMSGMALNKLLYELGVQYKKSDTWFLRSEYQSFGYTQTTTHVIDDEISKITTKWTQKGRLFIYDLLKANDILPMIEREEVKKQNKK